MEKNDFVMELTTELVSAYVSNNQLEAQDLPQLVNSVYNAMLTAVLNDGPQSAEKPIPAVPIDQSIFEDHLICLEDGQKYKSLKRHLRTQFNLTPKAYRDKWGLPPDYPMVAPSYSIERSRLAKRTGLGKT